MPIGDGDKSEGKTPAGHLDFKPSIRTSTSADADEGHHVHFALGRVNALPPCPEPRVEAEVWEVCSTGDASSLLAGCPLEAIVCCNFIKPYADGLRAQEDVFRRVVAAEPAGFVFASVNMSESPDVVSWAEVTSPCVQLLQADGVKLEQISSADVARGVLENKVLNIASHTAKLAAPRLEALSKRFPGSLHAEFHLTHPKDDGSKMQQCGADSIDAFGASDDDKDAFLSLCRIVGPGAGSGRVAKVRHVAAIAKMIRRARGDENSTGAVVPLLDLSRRLAGQKLLGGSEPGSLEALELLLVAAFTAGLSPCVSADNPLGTSSASKADTVTMLCLQTLANCFSVPGLAETLLPMAQQLTSLEKWGQLWQADWPPPYTGRGTQAAAAALLLNCSVALRSSRWRSAHRSLLEATVLALRRAPSNEHLNAAAANLLAVGGDAEAAKRVLQAQPLPALRSLAAATFRGDLEGPDGVAFPAAWSPPTPPGGGQAEDEARRRRRPPPGGGVRRNRRRG